jgi:hypothetical protein
MSPSQADAMVQRVFGYATREEHDRAATTTFAQRNIDLAIKIIDGEMGGVDVAAMHAEWATWERRRQGGGGRPPLLTSRQMLIILLMHALGDESMSKRHIADTLAMRLSDAQRDALGLPSGLDGDQWYKRLESAYATLLGPIDPTPMPKYPRGAANRPSPQERINLHRRLSADKRQALGEWRAANTELLQLRRRRLDDVMFALVANTVLHVKSAGLLDDFEGHLAIDATLVKVQGKATSSSLSEGARSTNIDAGAWIRKGNHAPSEKQAQKVVKLRFFGFDTELVAMATQSAPALIVGVYLHRPGALSDTARVLFPRIEALGLPAGEVSADRAYNNLDTESFHEVLLHHGYESVYQYPVDELGVQAYFYKDADGGVEFAEGKQATKNERKKGTGYLMVEGTWYLDLIPSHLINCVGRNLLPKENPDYIDDATCAARVKARADYQLVRHGRRDSDGYQRYRLPDRNSYIAFDPKSGAPLAKPEHGTVSIPLKIGLRWAQKHPYMSDAWRTSYNRRTEVERKNAQLKHSSREDLNNPLKRPGRGYAACSLAVAMLVTAHNLRTIDNYLRAAEGIDTTKSPRRRAPRRRAEDKLTGVRPQRDTRMERRVA